jgi:hypothetical protein
MSAINHHTVDVDDTVLPLSSLYHHHLFVNIHT